jgi:metal-dependent hydrolase (beta-lactamase superfamily II)
MPGELLGERAENDFKELLNRYKPLGSEMILKKESVNIADKFFTTGMLEDQTYEQALIVPTAKGLIIITGCAQTGILEIVGRSKELLKLMFILLWADFVLCGSIRCR